MNPYVVCGEGIVPRCKSTLYTSLLAVMIQDCYAKSLVVSAKKAESCTQTCVYARGRVACMRFVRRVCTLICMYNPHDLYFSAIF